VELLRDWDGSSEFLLSPPPSRCTPPSLLPSVPNHSILSAYATIRLATSAAPRSASDQTSFAITGSASAA
jgi:hypothetical protein